MTSDGKGLREVLSFYLDAGVDTLVGEAAVDRMADEAPPPALPAAQAPRPSPPRQQPVRELFQTRVPAAPASPDAAVMAAREAARTAASLDDLRALLEGLSLIHI